MQTLVFVARSTIRDRAHNHAKGAYTGATPVDGCVKNDCMIRPLQISGWAVAGLGPPPW